MQHYINYGYGFLSSKLKESEFDTVLNIVENDFTLHSVESKPGFVFFSDTEDYPQHDWSTAVLLDIGEMPNDGKAFSLSELNSIIAAHGTISSELRNDFLTILKKVGIEHMIDHVELVFYSNNC